MKNTFFSFTIIIFLIYKGIDFSYPTFFYQEIQNEDTNSFNIKDTALNYAMKGHAVLKIG